MLRIAKSLLVLCSLAALVSGCTPPIDVPSISVALELVDENQGWVQVRVSGIDATGYEIHWGDADAPYGVSAITPLEEVYEHFYQAVMGATSGEQIPTTYQISLVDSKGALVDQLSVLVPASVCHLQLVSLDGRVVTVEYWGRFGIEYSISWGDRFADHVMVSTQSAHGTATHTYGGPGTYSLGMEEIWAPTQIFFTIEVD